MLRAQDILVALALAGRARSEWRFDGLSQELGLSTSEIHRAIGRLRESGLVDEASETVHAARLLEFVVHGLKYVFPIRFGAPARGLATGPSAEPLRSILADVAPGDDGAWVWPSPAGETRGIAVEPLVPAAIDASSRNPRLHARLAAVDALRGGRARERRLAEQWLRTNLAL